MAIDIARAVGAVTREIATREHQGRPARVLVATRTYSTHIDDLWDAMTSAERIPRWFLPVSGELRLGGRYQLEGNASGEITACEPPRHLALTWEWGGDVSWVEVTLTESSNSGSELRLEHIAHVPDDFWDQYGPGATGVGWDLSLLALEEHFSETPSVDAESSEEWTVSEAGRAFVEQSSEAWGLASIAGGTEPSAARAAAKRITAFYTGQEEAGGKG